MSTQSDNRETLAIRAALKAFSETLDRELRGFDGPELEELDGTRHKHVSVLLGKGKPYAVIVAVEFTAEPAIVEGALKIAKGKGAA